MRSAVIVDAIRTAMGRHGGGLKDVRPDDLGAVVIKKLLERNPIDPCLIDDVMMGCANQAGEDNRNVARMSLLLAGLPVEVPGVTVNRLCGSGLEAVNQSANAIIAGRGDVYIAGGTESMTRAPLVMMKPGDAYQRGNQQLYDTTLGWRLVNSRMNELYPVISLGETAENVAERYGINRAAQDEFALESQSKYAAAQASQKWAKEIVPVEIHGRKGERTIFEIDEHPRPDVTLAQLAKLKPAFKDKVNPSSVILSGEMMLRHLGWTEAADLIINSIEKTIAQKLVTYDFARLMEGATELKASEFGDALIKNM